MPPTGMRRKSRESAAFAVVRALLRMIRTHREIIPLASSAAQTIQSSAHIHALHGKTHNKTSAEKTSSGDKFSDMLADSDAARDSKPAAPEAKDKTSARKADKADKPETEAAAKPDSKEDSKPVHTAKSETGKDGAKTEEKDGEKKEEAAANDNAPDATVELPLPQQQQQALMKLALEGGQAKTGAAEENIAVDAAQGDAKPAPTAPAPEAAATGTAKAGQAFEKALHETKVADKADAPPPAAAADTVKSADFKPVIDAATAMNMPAQGARAAEKAIATLQTAQPDAPPAPTPDVNQFAVDIAAKSQSGAKQFDIRLDPPELGRVEVRLSIDATGKAEAHLSADQPQTLDLLRKDSTALTQALRDAGLNVAQDGLNFSLRNQQGQGDGGSRQAMPGRNGFAGRPADETVQPEANAYVRRALGVVDIKV
jgi:hypothetical protein